MPMRRSILLVSVLSIISIFACAQAAKPKLTLDEFFNSVSFNSVKLSPDGNAVVIVTDHSQYDYPAIVAKARLVVDTRNATKGIRADNIVRC